MGRAGSGRRRVRCNLRCPVLAPRNQLHHAFGMRHVFSLPADLSSNWLFQITESQGRRDWMRAIEQFAVFAIIVPIYLISTPVAASALGWPVALRMAVLQFLASLIAVRSAVLRMAAAPLRLLLRSRKEVADEPGGFLARVLGVVTPVLTIVISTVARMPALFLIYGSFFVGDWIWARRRRLEGWGESRLIYQDRPGEVLSLGIKDMTWRSGVLAAESPRPELPEFPAQPHGLVAALAACLPSRRTRSGHRRRAAIPPRHEPPKAIWQRRAGEGRLPRASRIFPRLRPSGRIFATAPASCFAPRRSPPSQP